MSISEARSPTPPTQGTPTAEICDGLDNDRNPELPDGADVPYSRAYVCRGGSGVHLTARALDTVLARHHTAHR